MPRLSPQGLQAFHTRDFVAHLCSTGNRLVREHHDTFFHSECPLFPDMLRYVQLFCGASVGGAALLNHGITRTAVNWAGGMHHAQAGYGYGFCYANDAVLAILELLRYHARVLYVDIDIHHGDAVQEAFYDCNRVMTLSLHKYGDGFFPQTGALDETGGPNAQGCAVNVPLASGVTDAQYVALFDRVLDAALASFAPEAIVLQSGADSLAGDVLGVKFSSCFNLTPRGHAHCHRRLAATGLPLLVLGGGGYSVDSTALCWAYETCALSGSQAEALEARVDEWAECARVVPNMNGARDLEATLARVLATLGRLRPPSVQLHDACDRAGLPLGVCGGADQQQRRRSVRSGGAVTCYMGDVAVHPLPRSSLPALRDKQCLPPMLEDCGTSFLTDDLIEMVMDACTL